MAAGNNQKQEEPKVDYLEVDPEIPGQKFACMSFISPEDVIQDKNTYFVSRFLDSYVAKLKIDSVEKFLVDVLIPQLNQEHSIDIKVQDVLPRFEDFVRENNMTFREENVNDEYQNYLLKNGKTLEEKYHEDHNFQTSMRGIKIRGTYSTRGEAEMRARRLQKQDPSFNVYVGQVGYWLPWDPNPNDVQDQEYAEKELNELMKNYKENELKKKDLFEQEKRAAMEEALRSNRARQDKSAGGVQYENTTIPTDLFGTQGDQVVANQGNEDAAAVGAGNTEDN
jgi:hypothetical protein